MFILESSACENVSTLATILLIKRLVKVLSIIVPAILILLLSLDLGRAVIASDDDQIKHAQKLAGKRIIYSLIVFLTPILIEGLFSVLASQDISGTKCYTNANQKTIEELANTQKNDAAQKDKEKRKELEEKMKKEKEKEKEIKKNIEKLSSQKQKNAVNNKSNSDSVKTSNNSYNGKAKTSKSYSSVKILDTLTKKDFERVITVQTSSSTPVAQSFTVVGNYYVVGFVNYLNSKSYIGVYNKSTGKKVNSFNGLSFGHSNGMGYNSGNGEIYVTHGLLSRNRVHKFSAKNIASRKSIGASKFTLSRGVSGVSYDDVTGKLYYASGNKICRYSGGKLKEIVTRKNFSFGKTQDICVHNNIIYDIRINGGNTIDIHTTSGKYLGSYKVNVGNELESIDYYGEGGKMALLFHHSGGSTKHYIYVIDSIMPK